MESDYMSLDSLFTTLRIQQQREEKIRQEQEEEIAKLKKENQNLKNIIVADAKERHESQQKIQNPHGKLKVLPVIQ